MILKQVTVVAAPDDDPAFIQSYSWTVGDEPNDLYILVEVLNQYIAQRADETRTALMSQKPIDP